MTEKLFYEDSHLITFTASVQSCNKSGEYYEVVLDRTAFFPEGGGQSADTGMLNDVKVLDVHEKEDVIYHKTDKEIAPGSKVTGTIDWEDRFSKMQQHSGEHIISGLINQTYGYDNVGFHLGTEAVTMDFNGVLTKEQLREIEYRANEAVAKNLDIKVTYPSKEALKDMAYRSKIEIEGQVRIVTIEGYDTCASCAPHVSKTGEIGIIKLTNVQNYKGGVRVSMLCGFRALTDYNEKEASVKAVSVGLSAKENEIFEAVEQLKEEKTTLKSKIAELQMKLISYKVEKIEEGQKAVCLFEQELDGSAPRELVNLLLKKQIGVAAVFAGNDTDGYRYVIGSKTEDTREIAKALNAEFRGRGGGKPEMVQGSVNGTEREVYNYFICNFS